MRSIFSAFIALLFLNTGFAATSNPTFVNTIDLGDTIFIDVENAIVGAGYIDYPVYINSDDPIQSMDFQFFFNTAEFTYDTAFNNASLSSLLVNVSPEFNQGGALELRLTSFTFPGLYPNQTTLVTLRFTTSSVNPCNLNIVTNQNSVIQLGDNAFNAGPWSFVVLGCANPPAFAGIDQQICGSETTLTGNQPLQGTGTWSVVSGTGVFQDPNGTSTLVTGLSPGFNSFSYTLNNNPGDPENSDTVLVFSYENPSIASAGQNQIVCDAFAGLNAETPTIGTGTWSAPGTSLGFADETAIQTLVSDLIQGENQVIWTVNNGVCPPSIDTLIILRTDTVYAGPDQILCESSAFLQAAQPISGTGFWTVLSGTGTFEDANQSNTAVSDLSTGENIFQWTATGLDCIDSTDIVIITRLNLPSAAVAEADFATCTNSTQISATATAIGTGQWSSPGAGLTFADSTSAQTQVSGLQPGINELIWTVSNGSCPSNSDTLLVTLSDTVSAGIDQVVCDSAALLNASNPISGSGLWTVISGSGEFADAASPTSTVSGLSAGENIFQWTVSGYSCPDSTDIVIITRISLPSAAVAEADFTTCTNSTQISATAPAIGTGQWSSPGAGLTFADSTSAQTQVSGLQPGINELIWTVSNGSCPSNSDTLLVTLSDTVSAGIDQVVCDSSATLNASNPISGSGLWTVISGSGEFADAASPTSTVSGLSPGENIFQWTVSGINCPDSSDQVSIIVSCSFNVFAGDDTELCETFYTLQGSALPEGGTGIWTVLAGGGNFADASSPISGVSEMPIGTNTFIWTVTLLGTSISDTVNIVVSQPPTVALAGDDQSVCSNKATLSANTPLVGQGVWTTLSGNGTFVDASDPATTFVASEFGTDTLIWTISTGVCRSSDTVLVTTTEPPFINLPGDTTICENQQPLVLSINFSQGAQLQWNVLSGAALITGDQTTAPKLSSLPRGVTQIEVIAINGDCEDRDTINITVNSADSPECRNTEIIVPSGYSPNGDGTADFFVIENLNGRNAQLQVFNRWGQKVYEADSYQNDWNGIANKGIVLFGEQLPEGTYYYFLNIEGETETRKDFITLWR